MFVIMLMCLSVSMSKNDAACRVDVVLFVIMLLCLFCLSVSMSKNAAACRVDVVLFVIMLMCLFYVLLSGGFSIVKIGATLWWNFNAQNRTK